LRSASGVLVARKGFGLQRYWRAGRRVFVRRRRHQHGGANATNLFVGGAGDIATMNGRTGTASNFYFVDGNDQVNGGGAFNAMVELVGSVTCSSAALSTSTSRSSWQMAAPTP
jgi:hypothetical protein